MFDKKVKIQIKSLAGNLLFEYSCANNTTGKTVTEAIKQKADLRSADLRFANLRLADLSSADLRSANLSYANLSYANLGFANLSSADLSFANLSFADLGYANLGFANLSSANLSSADLGFADLSYANLSSANLRLANLSSADLSFANLSFADLRFANLRLANLSSADLSFANLSFADLRFANLRSAKNWQESWWTIQCKQNILFILSYLPKEVVGLKKSLIEGKVDGSQYNGDCACLVGTLGNYDGGVDKVCSTIPFYTKGLENFGEQFFWQIKKGDTPETNEFSKIAVELCDFILNKQIVRKIKGSK